MLSPSTAQREVHSSIFGFQTKTIIVSYVPKKGKSVILLSTLHKTGEITDIERKPQMILDYNSCKGGVDTLDQLVRTYSCKRKTNRWPFALFCNLFGHRHIQCISSLSPCSSRVQSRKISQAPPIHSRYCQESPTCADSTSTTACRSTCSTTPRTEIFSLRFLSSS